MRLLSLVDVLRAEGLTVHEYGDWRSLGSASFNPIGVVCHGTAGSLNSTDTGELRVIFVTGSNSAPEVPISQIYLSRTGQVWVGASGRATGVRTGEPGTPLAGKSDESVVQIEAQHAQSEPWSDVQYQAYIKVCAALVKWLSIPVSLVIGHGEHQPKTKSDPWFDMNEFRGALTAYLGGTTPTPTPTPTPGKNWTEQMIESMPTIRRGSKGKHVKTLQGLLIARGHATGVDGDFGPHTERMTRSMQSAYGAESVDGIAGPETWTIAFKGADER